MQYLESFSQMDLANKSLQVSQIRDVVLTEINPKMTPKQAKC